MPERVIEELTEDECLRLISAGGIGRIAFTSGYGPVVLPVNYKLHDDAIVFRTSEHGPLDEDLRTGIEGASYNVAFEIDELDPAAREGWSVLVQGPAHHVSDDDRARAEESGVESWAPGDRELFIRIIPTRITGRRITLA
jgi:nitroimidazol reductase NimA-like FMN-containing flavoprotein (pyridoxamine 5'-phosphate oxidase superfamily)